MDEVLKLEIDLANTQNDEKDSNNTDNTDKTDNTDNTDNNNITSDTNNEDNNTGTMILHDVIVDQQNEKHNNNTNNEDNNENQENNNTGTMILHDVIVDQQNEKHNNNTNNEDNNENQENNNTGTMILHDVFADQQNEKHEIEMQNLQNIANTENKEIPENNDEIDEKKEIENKDSEIDQNENKQPQKNKFHKLMSQIAARREIPVVEIPEVVNLLTTKYKYLQLKIDGELINCEIELLSDTKIADADNGNSERRISRLTVEKVDYNPKPNEIINEQNAVIDEGNESDDYHVDIDENEQEQNNSLVVQDTNNTKSAVNIHLADAEPIGKSHNNLDKLHKKIDEARDRRKRREAKVAALVPETTNSWLFAHFDPYDDHKNEEKRNHYYNNITQVAIAIVVILLQIAAYITMTWFLRLRREQLFDSRRASCYGPNCDATEANCMVLTTGGLTSVLLIGFLWADVISTATLIKYNKCSIIASLFILCELFTAIVCGFLVGMYSETDFEAIGGAVGILFVHDLDEKVYASMIVITYSNKKTHGYKKKALALILWIILSISIGFALACRYSSGGFFPTAQNACLQHDFQCDDGECIWGGFVCNGVLDCLNGEDEGDTGQCDYAQALQASPPHGYCPSDNIQCFTTGECIDADKMCDGRIDCRDGSDEGRVRDCTTVLESQRCNANASNDFEIEYVDLFAVGVNVTGFKQNWKGLFKCNNGQCINASYACDGKKGDCVDGSDEFPNFDKSHEYPYISSCPYSSLIQCEDNQVLCKVDGTCISKSLLCDGHNDCSNGADESLCSYECKTNLLAHDSFQCGSSVAKFNRTEIILFDETVHPFSVDTFKALIERDQGECIPIAYRCDGVTDCEDASDERLCELFPCLKGEYQCASDGACIPNTWLCDGENDCLLAEDEDPKTCNQNDNIGCAQYQCSGTTTCLTWDKLCDGTVNCPDFDDEDSDICLSINNWRNQVKQSSVLTCNGDIIGGTVEEAGRLGRVFYKFDRSSLNTITLIDDADVFVKFTTCNINTTDFDTNIIFYDEELSAIAKNDDYSCDVNPLASTLLVKKNKANSNIDDPEIDYIIDFTKIYYISVGHYADKELGKFGIQLNCRIGDKFTKFPTPAPTFSPTIAPTLNPSVAPSISPTLNPSLAPTLTPSVAPTQPPTLVPSNAPSISPTLNPSLAPTLTPSVAPTQPPSNAPSIAPSIAPTQPPSNAPSIAPTQPPSSAPSGSPSQPPSNAPSNVPTLTPTYDPTMEPTFDPTNDPTSDPTYEPTQYPTNDPTSDPTFEP
eukprot:390339_1